MSPARNRINAGRPDGGQYAPTTHSDAVPSLHSPAELRLRHIAAVRNHQLIIREQQEFLAAQKLDLDKQLRETAEAAAAIEILEVLPNAASITYRKDGSEVVFMQALDAAGETIVHDDDLADPESQWSSSGHASMHRAIRRSEEGLEEAEWHSRGWMNIDVNAVIAKAGTRLKSAPAPDLATDLLTPAQRKLLAEAAETA